MKLIKKYYNGTNGVDQNWSSSFNANAPKLTDKKTKISVNDSYQPKSRYGSTEAAIYNGPQLEKANYDFLKQNFAQEQADRDKKTATVIATSKPILDQGAKMLTQQATKYAAEQATKKLAEETAKKAATDFVTKQVATKAVEETAKAGVQQAAFGVGQSALSSGAGAAASSTALKAGSSLGTNLAVQGAKTATTEGVKAGAGAAGSAAASGAAGGASAASNAASLGVGLAMTGIGMGLKYKGDKMMADGEYRKGKMVHDAGIGTQVGSTVGGIAGTVIGSAFGVPNVGAMIGSAGGGAIGAGVGAGVGNIKGKKLEAKYKTEAEKVALETKKENDRRITAHNKAMALAGEDEKYSNILNQSRVAMSSKGMKLIMPQISNTLIPRFRRGGELDLEKENVILDGPSHDDYNRTGVKNDKGIPVVKGNVKIAEIESLELILNKNSSKELEELSKEYKRTKDKKVLEKIGKVMKSEINNNTYDYSKKFIK
jgi:hypothetical protein